MDEGKLLVGGLSGDGEMEVVEFWPEVGFQFAPGAGVFAEVEGVEALGAWKAEVVARMIGEVEHGG